jgi:threonine dehydratase
VVAASAGNHAQALAYHGARLGVPVTIVMPRATPFVKVEHTRGHGATVVLEGDSYDEAEAIAHRIGAEQGLTFVSAFNDAGVIAGQGTVALEMLEDVPELDTLIIPIGGGGLIAGCSVAAKVHEARDPHRRRGGGHVPVLHGQDARHARPLRRPDHR